MASTNDLVLTPRMLYANWWHIHRRNGRKKAQVRHELHDKAYALLDRTVNWPVLEVGDETRDAVDVTFAARFTEPLGPPGDHPLTVTLIGGRRPTLAEIANPPLDPAVTADETVIANMDLWPRWPHLWLYHPTRTALGGLRVARTTCTRSKPKGGHWRLDIWHVGTTPYKTLTDIVDDGWRLRRDLSLRGVPDWILPAAPGETR